MADALPAPRDVSELLGWLRQCTPGTLIPAPELLERVESLPAVNGSSPPPTDDEGPEQLLTAERVAEWFDVDRDRVYRDSRSGKLPCIRIGGNTLRFRRREVERWLDRRTE